MSGRTSMFRLQACARCRHYLIAPILRRTLATAQAKSITTKPEHAVEKPILTLDYSSLNSYTQTYPPTDDQLRHAQSYFVTHKPHHLFTAPTFRSFPRDSTVPEVAFLGRSNVGKSSLLNALFNRHASQTSLAHVSQRPGKTRTMNIFGLGQEGPEAGGGTVKTARPGMSEDLLSKRSEQRQPRKAEQLQIRNWIGRGGLAVVDCPGYGFASRKEWGEQVMKYLQNRTQLRRAFVLVDAEHGLKRTDREVLELLRGAGTPHQILLAKVDKILFPGSKEPSPERLAERLVELREICDGLRQELRPQGKGTSAALGDILCFSSLKKLNGQRLGIDGIRWAVLQACGLV